MFISSAAIKKESIKDASQTIFTKNAVIYLKKQLIKKRFAIPTLTN